MKMKNVFEVVKILVLVVNVIESVEYVERFIRRHRKPKTIGGFKTEEVKCFWGAVQVNVI